MSCKGSPTELLECDLREEIQALSQLAKSQVILRDSFLETKDRDFKAAFDDNIVVIAKKRARVAYLEDEISKIKQALASRETLGSDTCMENDDNDAIMTQEPQGVNSDTIVSFTSNPDESHSSSFYVDESKPTDTKKEAFSSTNSDRMMVHIDDSNHNEENKAIPGIDSMTPEIGGEKVGEGELLQQPAQMKEAEGVWL
mmetsp:Transcript_27910/g.51580  ORF Transcript_27910/g.51580 Transcript_27910/m.51580 type:complete len:199 (-) Transcript_27910:39-635(-)